MQISPKAILPLIPPAVAIVMCADSLKKHLCIHNMFTKVTEKFLAADIPEKPRTQIKILEESDNTIPPTDTPNFLPIAIGLIGAIALGTFTPATLSSSKALKISGIALGFHTFLTYRSKSLKQSMHVLDAITVGDGCFLSYCTKTNQNRLKAIFPVKDNSGELILDQGDQKTVFDWFKKCLIQKVKGNDIKKFLANAVDCRVEVVKAQPSGKILFLRLKEAV